MDEQTQGRTVFGMNTATLEAFEDDRLNVAILMVSHGPCKVKKKMHLYNFLVQQGFLALVFLGR